MSRLGVRHVNASRRLNRPLASKGVETRASAAANSSSIRQSTSATTIDRDLPQPKSGPKTAPKKGTRPPKSTAARLALAPGALKAALKVALKAALKAAVKRVIEKKAPPKARTTPLKRPTGKINKR